MKSRTSRFREMLTRPELEVLMEAHNGLSGRIVEQSGFQGIWASGLAISTAMGVRDSNEASWTQVLEVVEFISDATSIPVMLDADTGYGDFNNVRRLVRKLEQRGIAAMCIEDKLFPKRNSLLKDACQPLADLDEFVGKIKAAKDTQLDPDFSVVARTEAFIAKRGLDEALCRASAFAEAGADAVLIHSNVRTADEIISFMEAWDHSLPVIIVPTTYYDTPVDVFEKAGVSMVVWANHLMRSCVTAMQRAASSIRSNMSPIMLESEIARVAEVFGMFEYDELKRAEGRYLPSLEEPSMAAQPTAAIATPDRAKKVSYLH